MSVMWNRKSLLIVGIPALLAATAWAQSSVPKTQSTAATGLGSLRHIIVLAQENRSFDQYFGELRQYWAQNGYPDQSFDGLPQFNPKSGIAPLYGPPPAIPGCDPAFPPRAIVR